MSNYIVLTQLKISLTLQPGSICLIVPCTRSSPAHVSIGQAAQPAASATSLSIGSLYQPMGRGLFELIFSDYKAST